MVNVASTSVRSLQDTAQSETQYRLPQLTSVVDAGSAFERAANSRKHSIIMAPSGQLESLGSIDVMSQRDEKKLKDTAIYAAGLLFINCSLKKSVYLSKQVQHYLYVIVITLQQEPILKWKFISIQVHALLFPYCFY